MRIVVLLQACAIALSGSVPAAAVPISFGALSSNDDGSTEIITDRLNTYEWLRWDVLANLNYAQTLAAIGTGGSYEGWKIAGIKEAQKFTNALLGVAANSCPEGSIFLHQCSPLPVSVSLDALIGGNFSSSSSYAWFRSDNSILKQVGVVRTTNNGLVKKTNEWGSVSSSDVYSATGAAPQIPITWLLYRDVTVVPLPASLPLLAGGMVGLVALKRWRRKRV